MTIGGAQRGPGPMPAIVAGLVISIILTRFTGLTKSLLIGAGVAVVVHVVVMIATWKEK